MVTIAFVSVMTSEPWGGSEELWSRAALCLAQREDVRVGASVFWWPQLSPKTEALALAGVQVSTWGRRVDYSVRARLRRLPTILRRRLLGWSPPHWLDTFRPDLLVISQGGQTAGQEWMDAARARGIPYALVVQAASEMWWPQDELLLPLADGFADAAACFFVSHGNLELVRRQMAVALPRAEVVRNPFNVPYDAAPPWPSESEGYQLACVGRLDASAKGQDLLFDVLRQDKWRARPLSVTLYGRGINEESLRRLARLHGLDSVRFGGYVSGVQNVWAEHHALVLPSRHEGLPLAVVEAMLCGRPCIVTDVAGNTEIVTDGVNGFVAAAPTPGFWDDALERAWARRAEWRQMGQAAARDARAFVPADPAVVFAERLLSLAQKERGA